MKATIPLFALAALLCGSAAYAQQPVTPDDQQPAAASTSSAAQQGAAIERTARRFRLGVEGGAGLDPEIIDVGIHMNVERFIRNSMTFRPGLEIGAGEITTLLNINLDVLYTFADFTEETRWVPYVGAGPTFGLSHRGVSADDVDDPDIDELADRNRFDFSDTDFNGGINFIVGMRKPSGVFFEMKATAWGVSNIRLLAGFDF
jgi:hypothetical protein